jgi:hypothetical protein
MITYGPLKALHHHIRNAPASPDRRQAIDDFESHLGEATEKCERNRGKYERLARMLGREPPWCPVEI